jgi:hypothetical protein
LVEEQKPVAPLGGRLQNDLSALQGDIRDVERAELSGPHAGLQQQDQDQDGSMLSLQGRADQPCGILYSDDLTPILAAIFFVGLQVTLPESMMGLTSISSSASRNS